MTSDGDNPYSWFAVANQRGDKNSPARHDSGCEILMSEERYVDPALPLNKIDVIILWELDGTSLSCNFNRREKDLDANKSVEYNELIIADTG